MSNGEDWLMRPVLAQICGIEALHDTRLTLADFADMNEALDVQNENIRRLRAAGAQL